MTDNDAPHILVTGATGKVGQTFLRRFFSDDRFEGWKARALCQGSISDREVARRAIDGVTHVLHLATCKETPDDVMDVTVKGLFWLLEECRTSDRFEQFILIGGDAGMGHFFYDHDIPVTEEQGHSAYPGCYALSKVLEEVMLEQYYIQYGLGGCCLRAPWIMEKDDFKYTMSFGDDVFGGPRWCDLVGPELASKYTAEGTVPVLCDSEGVALDRNFVHVDDLVEAIVLAIDNPKAHQETFNVCMDVPVNYRTVAEQLAETHGLPSVDIETEFESTWLDNAKAKFLLRWQPGYDTRALVDAAYSYRRSPDDPRRIWYPG